MQVINHCRKCKYEWDGHWKAIQDWFSPTCPKCGAKSYEHGQQIIYSETDECNDEVNYPAEPYEKGGENESND